MEKSPLSRVVIQGFRSIDRADLVLDDINVLIGPNGAGKSNLISFFQMLSALVEGRLRRYVGQAGGADALLHYGRRHTSELGGELYFGRNEYLFSLEPTAEDAFIFSREVVKVEGSLFDGLSLGEGHREAKISEVAKSRPYDGISDHIVSSIRSWRVYHFHDTSSNAPVKQTRDVHVNDYLRPDASNLAAFLYLLQQKHPESYDRIRSAVRLIFPKFGDFVLRPEPLNANKIRLKWQEAGSDYPFLADQLSDGTLRYICLATVLLQPSDYLPATMLIDEPELGLHPAALTTLAELIREAARRTQIVISTQSVPLVDEFEPEHIITVDRDAGDEGASSFHRHTTEELAYWLKEYSLSEVWEKNIIGGRP